MLEEDNLLVLIFRRLSGDVEEKCKIIPAANAHKPTKLLAPPIA
jgi:hypothetical protein